MGTNSCRGTRVLQRGRGDAEVVWEPLLDGAQGSLKTRNSGGSRSAMQESWAGGGHWYCSEKGTWFCLLLKEFVPS